MPVIMAAGRRRQRALASAVAVLSAALFVASPQQASAAVTVGASSGAQAIASAAARDASASVTDDSAAQNPIRRVVTMLQKMAAKVEEEAEKEAELYDKFMCYCKTSGGDLAKTIAENTAAVPQVQSDIEQGEAELKRLKQELISHQEDRTAAKEALEAATAQRETEHKAFVASSTEYRSYLSALGSAIPAIEKGMSGGALLQSQAKTLQQQLRQAISADAGVTEYDRELVTAFLSGTTSDSEGYVPKSSEILGILKSIQEDFQKNLDEVVSAEDEAKKIYEELTAAKSKQIEALGAAIEKKMQRTGDLQVELVNMRNELTEAEASLVADQKLAAELGQTCDTKSKDWEERQKLRAEELQAIHETIKVLNDDDSLDLFKATLPSASFLQLRDGRVQLVHRTFAALQEGLQRSGSLENRPAMDFLMLMLTGRKVDFSKVHKMIDDMVNLLKQEQADDDNKKEYCEKQIDSIEDKAKELGKKVEDIEASQAEKADQISTLVGELKALQEGIKELDKSVQEETEMRKADHEEFTELMSSNQAAKELLNFAKNRLNKFYHPKLYKAPPKQELSEQDRMYSNLGGTFEPTDSPGGIADTGVEAPAALVQIARHGAFALAARKPQPPPPETWGAYQKKEEGTGVIAMIDLLIKDLDKEMTEGETSEKASQKSYEEFLNDAAKKRAADMKSVAAKQKAKADFEEGRSADEAHHQDTTKELTATKMFEMQLHQECDWLIQNFELRKTARAEETESLKQAKAILSGADFALLQSGVGAPPPAAASLRRLRGAMGAGH